MRSLLSLLFLCWLGTTTTTLGFQPVSYSVRGRTAVGGPKTVTQKKKETSALFNLPNPFGGGGGDNGGAPKKKISLPELDFEGIGGKAIAGVATIVAFLAIQKLGLMLSETFTPVLTAEDIANFNGIDFDGSDVSVPVTAEAPQVIEDIVQSVVSEGGSQ